ncbi:MAG: hybrid sensor histidine kinase/response regulator [Sandaracinaceae bacterium]|nr:hybrid sensor histidine kinase/response regulator [Sandaracinaceae bacterium]
MSAEAQARSKGRLRALIVEDSQDDAALLVMELRKAGYELTHKRVDTYEAMTAALQDDEWDVVLADFSMPRFNAMAALETLKESKLDLPFIIISGTIGEEFAVEALKAGAHDFLIKGRLARLLPAIDRETREAKVRRERRETMEKLLVTVRARDEFLSIASHELKTPITTLELQLASGLRLLRARDVTEVPLERLESKLVVALRQVDRLTALVNHLLDVTKINAGQLTFSRATTDLGKLVDSQIARLDVAVKRARCEVIVHACHQVIGMWDRRTLETVITNLLTNALKFGEAKPIEIRVEREGELARLIVKDQGIGIAPDEQARIFQRFERAVSSQHYGGLGLGLWVTKQVVEAHGGNIRVESVVGAGSTFTVELPLGETTSS